MAAKSKLASALHLLHQTGSTKGSTFKPQQTLQLLQHSHTNLKTKVCADFIFLFLGSSQGSTVLYTHCTGCHLLNLINSWGFFFGTAYSS